MNKFVLACAALLMLTACEDEFQAETEAAEPVEQYEIIRLFSEPIGEALEQMIDGEYEYHDWGYIEPFPDEHNGGDPYEWMVYEEENRNDK